SACAARQDAGAARGRAGLLACDSAGAADRSTRPAHGSARGHACLRPPRRRARGHAGFRPANNTAFRTPHCRRALAAALRAYTRLALALLLPGATRCFLTLAFSVALPPFGRAVVFGCTRLVERDRNRLFAALHPAAFAAATAFQLAMLVFVHDAAGGLSLAA